MTLIAIVRVRSNPRMSASEEANLAMLHLNTPNSCALIENTPQKLNMAKSIEGMLTWGDVSDDTVALLRKKAGNAKAMKFRLNPPQKGYGRKGVKMPFSSGGALGYRGDKINDLIRRMVA